MVWKTVFPISAGTSTSFGGADVNRISNMFSGTADADGMDFNSTVKFRDQKLVLRNPANTFDLTIKNPIITADRAYQFEDKYSYLVFIDTDDGNLIKAKNGHTGAIDYINSDAAVVLNSVFTALSTTAGGLVFLKRGTYVISSTVSVGVVGTPTSYVRLHGESKDSTIIQFSASATSANMIQTFCSFAMDNIQLDGNSKANNGLYLPSTAGSINTIAMISCRFKNCLVSEVNTTAAPTSAKSVTAKNCYFDITASTSPQFYCSDSTFVILEDNYFDKTTGTLGGDNISVVGTKSVAIRNNVINRDSANIQEGIRVDQSTSTVAGILIEGNALVNARIYIGGTSSTGTMRNILVTCNEITGGGIFVTGNSTVTPLAQTIQNAVISNNNIKNAYLAGIQVQYCPGPLSIRDNILFDSNLSANATTADKGLIYVLSSTDIEITNNIFDTSNTTANTSPYHLKLETGTTTINNVRVLFNRFVNENSATLGVFITTGSITGLTVKENAGFRTSQFGVYTKTATSTPLTQFYSVSSPDNANHMASDLMTRYGEKVRTSSSDMIGRVITQIDVYLGRSNSSVKGTMTINIRKGSDDSVAFQFATFDVNTLSGSSFVKYSFVNTNNTYALVEGDKVLIEYAGVSSSTGYLRVDENNSGGYDGSDSCSVYMTSGSYSTNTGRDYAGNMWTGSSGGATLFTIPLTMDVVPDMAIVYAGNSAASGNGYLKSFTSKQIQKTFKTAPPSDCKFFYYAEKSQWP